MKHFVSAILIMFLLWLPYKAGRANVTNEITQLNLISLTATGTYIAAGNNNLNYFNELEASISLDKSIYLEGENITLGLAIKNISGKEFRIRDLDQNFIHCNFKITNALGKEAEYIGDIADNFFSSRYDTFKVDEVRGYRLFLLDDYTSKRDNNYDLALALGRIPGLLEEGNYTIVFSVMLDDSKALESNTINFAITKPMGDEVISFVEIQEISRMITRGSYIEKINRFREYIYKFSESVYMDQAFYCMMWLEIFPNSTNEHTFEDCNWLITRKPNSSVIDYAFWGIEYVFEKKKDSNGFKSYLQEIVKKHPDTKASALAQKFLAEKFKE